jgi:hypothetical protein
LQTWRLAVHDLLQGVLDDVRALEDAAAFNRAKRQQIAMNAAI